MNRRRRRAPILWPLTIAIALVVASLYALEALAGWLAPAPVAERATVQPPPGFGGSIQTLWFLGGHALVDPAIADADTLPSLTCAELARRYVSMTWRCRNFGRDGMDSLAALHRLVTLLRDPDIVRPDNVILIGGDEDLRAASRPRFRYRVAGEFPHLLRLAGLAGPVPAPTPADMARAGVLYAANLRTLADWAEGAQIAALAMLLPSSADAFRGVATTTMPAPRPAFSTVDVPAPSDPRDIAHRLADQITVVERF